MAKIVAAMNKYKCRTRKYFYVVPKTISECIKFLEYSCNTMHIKKNIYIERDIYFRSLSCGMLGVRVCDGVMVCGLCCFNVCLVLCCYGGVMV